MTLPLIRIIKKGAVKITNMALPLIREIGKEAEIIKDNALPIIQTIQKRTGINTIIYHLQNFRYQPLSAHAEI